MSLNVRGDIYHDPTATTVKGGCASGSIFLQVTQEPKAYKYSVSNSSITLISSATLAANTPTDIVFISPATAVIGYTSTARVDFFDINTFATAGITTNVTNSNKSTPQQIAGNHNIGFALKTSSTTGRLTLISQASAAAVNPTFLSGKLANCIITRPDTNTWLIGTNDGKIHEIDQNMNLVTSVFLPSSNFIGTTQPTINVQSLAYYGGYVLAATDLGALLTYNWTTKTVVAQSVAALGSSTSTVIMSNAASGVVLISNTGTPINNYKGISEVYFDNPNPLPLDSTTYLEANIGVASMGIEPTGAYVWICSTSSTFIPCRIYTITSPRKVLVSTEVQNPIGNDVAGRIIRLREANDVGNATVEIDQTVFPGPAAVQCTDSRNYTEVCIYGNIVNGNPPYTGWDVREFQS